MGQSCMEKRKSVIKRFPDKESLPHSPSPVNRDKRRLLLVFQSCQKRPFFLPSDKHNTIVLDYKNTKKPSIRCGMCHFFPLSAGNRPVLRFRFLFHHLPETCPEEGLLSAFRATDGGKRQKPRRWAWVHHCTSRQEVQCHRGLAAGAGVCDGGTVRHPNASTVK